MTWLSDMVRVDVKTTGGKACTFKLNRRNRNHGKADALLFVHINRLPEGWQVRLLGWCWFADALKHVRWDFPPHDYKGFVRFEALEKKHVAQPIWALKHKGDRP
ncbi:MAG: hypothetical protein KC475_09810 [Cyanobacteria bacterium HKST-UBA03]|nr:hypothetical protein [Cyanobacteria bacterium HKST-UBA03]